jgi:hypothetical protein
MHRKRTLTLTIIGAALIAWLAGAATSNRETAPPPMITRAPVDAKGADLAKEIARLHERLRPEAIPHQPGRNLFLFARPTRVQAHAEPADATKPVLSEPARPAPMLPALQLAGIAEDAGPNGPERTAIISGDGQLFLVKEGEAVTPRYRVAKIAADVVELTDALDGSTRRLPLK